MIALGLGLTSGGLALFLMHHTPQGAEVYALAALPAFFIFSSIVVVGRYLRDETDEFERDQVVRSLLWGTGVLLAISTYFSFLRELGWAGHTPFLLELSAFCWAALIARWRYRRSNRVAGDA
jgi:hypothetical protein